MLAALRLLNAALIALQIARIFGYELHNPLETFQTGGWSSEMDASAYNISLEVSKTHLSAKGGWLDVTWSNVPYPGSDDLVALYVPADAQPQETGFAKYQWAIASPDHLLHGKGSLRQDLGASA